MIRFRTPIVLFAALLLSNAILLYSSWDALWLRWPAAVALAFILPGWAWLPYLNWFHTSDRLERIVLVGSFSSLFSALALFITVLLPGSFNELSVLITLNAVILAGLLSQLILSYPLKTQALPPHLPTSTWAGSFRPPPQFFRLPGISKTSLILLAIFIIAACLRLPRLSYAEFHEDELENMRLIVAAYRGEEYAPFLDSKGPIHWLLPAALWYLNGWLTEGVVRSPFALASLLLIPLIFSLGRRMSGGRDSIGLLAAGFVAVNGFFVAYARFIENQSLIVLWGALAVWLAYRYYTEDRYQFLLWLAFTLAIGLIAHPDVLLYLPVFAFIIGFKLYHNRSAWRSQWPWLLGASLIFVGLSGLFYVPYLTDPDIGAVGQYFAEERIGQSLLYNRVYNLFDQDKLYSTHYHAPLLVLFLTWLLLRLFGQWGWRGWSLFGLLALAIISTVALPHLWLVRGLTFAFIPYALLTLILLFLPKTPLETKILFLWFSAPLGALLFLAKDAADHIQIAYPAWALLAAFGLANLWHYLGHSTLFAPISRTALRVAIVATLALAGVLILIYQYLAFLAPVTVYWQVKSDSESNPTSIYNRLYGSIPRPRKIFSNPRLGGWKAVGYLWETGQLSGDFRSINESFATPIWYTFQTPRSCYNDPQHYWVQRDWQGWPEEEADLAGQGYTLTRVVFVDQHPKLHLYEKNAPPGPPETLDLEAYRHKFDLLATPARFASEEDVTRPASFNFGDKLLLRGYDLPQAVRRNQLLPVTVYWEGLAPMEIRYRAFVHLVDSQEVRWGQQDDDPACRLLTTDIRPGQRASRQFRVPVDPAAPPGEYKLILGVYQPETMERLAIWDNLASQSPGDYVVLGQVKIE
jgi:4-amino-4-deoxy-L-arabinose transferase-like glycosyltransferase